MSIYTDPMTVQTEVDRRLELAGVDPYDRHHVDQHRRALPARPLAAHPLAAFVARLVSGRDTSAPAARPQCAGVTPGVSRHP